MRVDWVATLEEQADLVRNIAKDVDDQLNTDLTIEQASGIYRFVESKAQNFDRLLTLMSKNDLDASFIDAAEIIEDLWTDLSIATVNRLRTLCGLSPIDGTPV